MLRLLLAVVLTQQLLSIPFNSVMLDFLLPPALSARSSSAACQLQQEKAPRTDGRWADNGGGRGCFFLCYFFTFCSFFFPYLDGVAGDLNLVEFAHGAVAVDEVRRGELVQCLDSLGGVDHLPVQLVLGHVHGESFLT